MKTFYKLLCILVFNCVLFIPVLGQTSRIFGVYTSGGTSYAAMVDPATGTLTNFAPLATPLNSLSTASTTTNSYSGYFYFSNGYQISTYDVNTGNLIDSSEIYPLSLNANFVEMQFNNCDSTLYGIYNPPFITKLAKLNPMTGALTVISTQNLNGYGSSTLDPYNNVYYTMTSTVLKKISLSTGVGVDVNIVNLPSETFERINFDCGDSILYGLSANTSAMTKYLSTIDPLTGIVSHVSTSNLNNYFWKLVYGGKAIDPTGQEYYYISGANILVGVNLLTGIANNVNVLALTGTQSFEYITYYPQCLCSNSTTGAQHFDSQSSTLLISPNPTTGIFQITFPSSSNHKTHYTLEIISTLGQTVFSSDLRLPTSDLQTNLDVSFLPKGIYVLIINDGITAFTKKIIIQ